ncbi:hypothetical protein EMPS_09734 [Entomortierella parvispora]|uniref:Transmembrane protein n=1 Tax=Entomortierella parvispora TaxID=205924 RepID=A0A9P3HIU9_9FUNG|nr:hypothetical protein EMPS_09734 [Entomortierella parvispora]
MEAQPIQPFCVTSANGTVYAASFAYNRRAISTAEEPDWFLLIRSSPASAETITNVAWSVVSLTLRTALNLFPDIPFFYNCALSPDGSTFLLRVALETQQFTVSLSTLVNSSSPIGYVPDSGAGNNSLNPLLATQLSDLLPVQELSSLPSSTNSTAGVTTGTGVDQEWIQIQMERLGSTLYFSRTSQGSFPRTPQVSIPVEWANECYGMAYDQRNLYMLSANPMINSTSLLQSIPIAYNASLPNWIAPISLSNVVNVTIAETIGCSSALTTMATQGSIIHIICFSDEPKPPAPTYMQWDTNAMKFTDSRTLDSISTDPTIGVSTNPTLAVFNSIVSLYADGQSLFWIDLIEGSVQEFTMTVDPTFTSNNMNPDMTSQPMTISPLETLIIIIAALCLGIFLIIFQRLYFKWRARQWLKEMDNLGSKVVVEDEALEEEDSDTEGEENLSSTRPKLRRRTTSAPTVTENDTGHVSTPSSSSQSPTVNGTMLFEPSAPAMLVVGEPLTGEGPSARDGQEEFEMRAFSSHPRPTIVTSITDGSTDETAFE